MQWFPHFSRVFPKVFVFYTLESKRLFYCLKIERGNWSSFHGDKTKWNNKCLCISLEFTKYCPIYRIFSPRLSPELLLSHARWLSSTLDHIYPISLSDLLSPLHILLDGILDPWAHISFLFEYILFPFCFFFILFSIPLVLAVIFMLFQEVFCCILC